MDQIEDQKLLGAAKLDKYYLLRRSLQVVISAFVLSLFFFYYPGVFFFPYSLSHTLERRYMFLICNGILAFLAKSSVSRCESYSDEALLGGKVSVVSDLSEAKAAVVDEEETTVDQLEVVEEPDEEREDQQGSKNQPYDQDNPHEALTATSSENDDLEEGKNGGRFSSKQDGEEEEEEEEETADEEFTNTDELNKKFEEFIRKMKEELRIQAQQQLITV